MCVIVLLSDFSFLTDSPCVTFLPQSGWVVSSYTFLPHVTLLPPLWVLLLLHAPFLGSRSTYLCSLCLPDPSGSVVLSESGLSHWAQWCTVPFLFFRNHDFIVLDDWVKFCYIHVPHFLYPSICCQTPWLVLFPGCFEHCSNREILTQLSLTFLFLFLYSPVL